MRVYPQIDPALIGRAAATARENVWIKFPVLQQWIDGEKKPTVKQLADFAKEVHIPFGFFFLEALPENTYYTIIKISPNTAVGDTVSIGLLVWEGNRVWLKISEGKKNLVKQLIEYPDTVDFAIEQLTAYIKTAIDKPKLFQSEPALKSRDIERICKHSTGVLQCSQLSHIHDFFNSEKFEKLYSLLIGNKPIDAGAYTFCGESK